MFGLGWWLGWAGRRTCNALTICEDGAVVGVVSNSTTCQHCTLRAKVSRTRAVLRYLLFLSRFEISDRNWIRM